jgi:hypothetical protein
MEIGIICYLIEKANIPLPAFAAIPYNFNCKKRLL